MNAGRGASEDFFVVAWCSQSMLLAEIMGAAAAVSSLQVPILAFNQSLTEKVRG